MERVQYHLERSLPQLQLLDEAGIFTKEQLHSITSQRQSHEARLIRRAPQKVDFLRYADFEQNLSDLIVTKAFRMDLGRHFTQQNYALHTGHIVGIWERLVRRFKWDVDSWQRYIEWANKRKMRVVVGRLYARALSLHPNKIPLWLSAASHELNNNSSTTAARSLLQRALRQNALPWKARDAAAAAAADGSKRKNQGDDGADDATKKLKTGESSAAVQSFEAAEVSGPLKLKLSTREADLLRLWIEYFRMELVFIERLRRRWIVLGIQWEGEDKGASAIKSDDPEVSAVAESLQAEAEAAQDDGDDNEKMLLSQVPEREEGVEADTDADGRSERPSESSKPNTYTQRPVAEIPPAQLAILRGSIPVFLIGNALSTLPPSLHFVFLLALLELFRNFPFADSTGNAISGQKSSKKAFQTFATKSGQALRMRLINTVYDVLSQRERWSWRYYAPVATLVATRVFRDPQEKLLSAEEEMEADGQMTEELRNGERLAKSSALRTTFSEDSDALLDLAEWIRMGGGNRSATSSSLSLRLILQLLEAALVDKVEGEGDEAEPSLLSLRLARNGLIPQAVQRVVETLRPLCLAAPLPTTSASLLSSFNAKSDFYTASTLLLNLLSDTKRSGIDEPNLLKYLDGVKAELISEARRAGHGVESGQMRALVLRRKYGALVDDDGLAAAATEAEADKRRKKLAKAIKEVEEATAPSSKGGFQGNEDLWRLRIKLKISLSRLDEGVARERRQKLSAEWKRGLLACSIAELESDSANGDEGSGDDDGDASALQGRLWNGYFDWVQSESQQMVAGVEAGVKAFKRAAKWVHTEYEASIRTTSSLLSRTTVSKVRATSNLSTLQAKKQATHDLVLKRYVALCSEIDARSPPSVSGVGKPSHLDRAINTILSSAFGSENFYSYLVTLLISVRDCISEAVVSSEDEEEQPQPATTTVTRVDARIVSIFERSIEMLASRLAASPRTAENGKLAHLWLEYLGFLVANKSGEMANILKVLERGKSCCRSAFGKDEDKATHEVKVLERGWEKVCDRLGGSMAKGGEALAEQNGDDAQSDGEEDA
ncbi:U3 snoRNP protein [Thecaphora frezii]